MGTIFVSYRRSDSGGHTGRLFDALQQRFGRENVFRDIEDLEPGIDFPEALDRALAECQAMLVMIGPTWTSVSGAQGPRLEEPQDLVRREVAVGLARKDVRVIPVLVAGATMPSADDLPEAIKALAQRNAIELSDTRWEYDVTRLEQTLSKHLGLATSPVPATPVASTADVGRSGPSRTGMLATGALALIAMLALAVWSGGGSGSPAASMEDGMVPVTERQSTPSDVFTVGDIEWTTTARGPIDWSTAAAHCSGLEIGGQSGWRLPTRRELRTIYDPSDVDAFNNRIMRPFHAGLSSNWIWSADKDTAAAAFAVDFKNGDDVSLAANFDQGAGALCVRTAVLP